MAPEGGLGELIVFDFYFERRLVYQATRISGGNEPLYVLWQASSAPDIRYQAVGGGVVYVARKPELREEKINGEPTDLGGGTFQIEDYTAPVGSMMVFVLPPGHTMEPVGRMPKAAKDFNGRIAVYWRLEGGTQVAVRWKLGAGSGNVHDDAVHLNRAALDAPLDAHLLTKAGPLVEGDAPRVFVSYSSEGDEHVSRVRAFTNQLRSNGVDAIIYDYDPAPPDGLSTWMRNQIQESDFVLIVCTPEYKKRYDKRAESGKGVGVTWEANLIQILLREASTRNKKFIPVLLDVSAKPEDCIPTELRDVARYTIANGKDYVSLLRRLTNQPAIIKPELGPIPDLPPE